MMIQTNEIQTMKTETESYLQTNEVVISSVYCGDTEGITKRMETYLQQLKLIDGIASQFCVGDTR